MRTKAKYEGKHFGLLTVMECLIDSDGKNKGGVWLCKCKCGGTISLAGYRLHNRDSCGCLTKKATEIRAKNNKKPQEEKDITKAYSNYKRKGGELTKEKWLKAIKKPCIFCASTLLRTDTTICNTCFTMMGNLSENKFLEQVKIIAKVSC
jgi:hypothetical protein